MSNGGPEYPEHNHRPDSKFKHTRPITYGLESLKQGQIRKTHLPPDQGLIHERILRDYILEQPLRAEIVRFEREKLRDLLTEARQRSIGGELGQESLVGLRKEVNEFTQKLDVLNRRMPMVNTDLEILPGDTRFVRVNIPGLPEANVPPLGEVGIRGVVLDLRSDEEKQRELHPIPLVFFTGWSADFKSPAANEILAAADGRVVISVSMPEHYTTVKPRTWGEWIKRWSQTNAKDLSISPYWSHAQVMFEVLKKIREQEKGKKGMDFTEIDLTGVSAGGALDLSLADYLTAYPDPYYKSKRCLCF